MCKLLKITIIITLLINSVGHGYLPRSQSCYALRPPATARRDPLTSPEGPGNLNADKIYQPHKEGFIVAKVAVFLLIASTLFFWSFGISEVTPLIPGLDYTVWSKAMVFASLIMLGDAIGTHFSDAPRHNMRQYLERMLIVFTVGLLVGLNARAVITGIGHFVPRVGLWSLQNAGRAFLVYAAGAGLISLFYFIPIPGYFAKKVTRENFPGEVDSINEKYTLSRQITKTWHGVKNRYPVVLANYWYMNILPWGWLSSDIGMGIVFFCINIYISFKSTSNGINAPLISLFKRTPPSTDSSRSLSEKKQGSASSRTAIQYQQKNLPNVSESLAKDLNVKSSSAGSGSRSSSEHSGHPRYFISEEPDAMRIIADKIDGLGKNQRILSIGPGKLELEKELVEMWHTVVCVDINDKYLKKSNLPYVIANANHLEFPESSFDTILLCESIGYLSSLDKGLKDIHKFLRPGGHIVIVQPHPTSKIIFDRLISRYEREENAIMFYPHYRIQSPTGTEYEFYTAKDIKEALERCDFRTTSHLALFPQKMLGLRDFIIAEKPDLARPARRPTIDNKFEAQINAAA